MSDEETKGEAGEAEVALTDEERLYQDAVADYDDARNDFREAKIELKQWKADHAGYALSDPDLVRLKQDVNDANQRLKDANQLLKDARAAAGLAEHAGEFLCAHALVICVSRVFVQYRETNICSIKA